jgi:hypothetical protein
VPNKPREPQVTLLYAGKVWRSAGCRLPEINESFVSRSGHIVTLKVNDQKPSGDRLIVRELPPANQLWPEGKA